MKYKIYSILLQESKHSHNTCSKNFLGLSKLYLENNSKFLLALQMSSKDALQISSRSVHQCNMTPEKTLNANFTPDCKMKPSYSRKPNAEVRNLLIPASGTGRLRTRITDRFSHIYICIYIST